MLFRQREFAAHDEEQNAAKQRALERKKRREQERLEEAEKERQQREAREAREAAMRQRNDSIASNDSLVLPAPCSSGVLSRTDGISQSQAETPRSVGVSLTGSPALAPAAAAQSALIMDPEILALHDRLAEEEAKLETEKAKASAVEGWKDEVAPPTGKDEVAPPTVVAKEPQALATRSVSDLQVELLAL